MKKSIILLLLCSCLFGCAQEDVNLNSDDFNTNVVSTNDVEPTVSISTSFSSGAAVSVELARTQEEQELGLMFRDELAPFSGLLFLFDFEAVRNFTMINTFIPLDIIFIDSNFVIVDIERDTIPNTAGPFTTSIPFMYALEVNAGFSESLGILPGDTVTFSGFDF